MSVLTKVFVVLVTVLSILLVALVVPFVANTENYRERADAADQKRQAALLDAEAKQRLLEGARAQEAQNIQTLNSAKNALDTQIAELNKKLADAQANELAAKSDKVRAEADFSRLTAAEAQHAQINQDLEKELTQRREDTTSLRTQVIQLADRIKQIESERQALDRERQRAAETIVQLQADNTKLNGILATMPPELRNAGGPSAPKPFESETTIPGQITKVEHRDGETFVQINVGKNDGVAENMKFMVYRGDQYLGSLVVTYVDAKAAAGRMQLEKGSIAPGDKVLTGGR